MMIECNIRSEGLMALQLLAHDEHSKLRAAIPITYYFPLPLPLPSTLSKIVHRSKVSFASRWHGASFITSGIDIECTTCSILSFPTYIDTLFWLGYRCLHNSQYTI